MAVQFLSPLADASQFPIPHVSATPKFRLMEVKFFQNSHLELRNATYTRNGRGAIGIAGELLKKPGKNVILIPAYHCPALVEPFIWLGYEIRFYAVQPDLSIDIENLKTLLSKGDVTHCIVIRYFGFSQNVCELIDFLSDRGVYVIEDCAHALFSFLAHFNPKRQKYERVSASICSINKILPTIDGGALYVKNPLNVELQQVQWMEELKACAFLLGIPKFVNKISSLIKFRKTDLVTDTETSETDLDNQLRYFQPIDRQSASYRHTHYILRKTALNDVMKKRRKNYQYLLKKIYNPEVGNPLLTKLNSDVPYVMPFLLKDEKHFSTLRSKGIQILRWEELALSDCPVSREYRSKLIQLPCHQQLKSSELDFIINTINNLKP